VNASRSANCAEDPLKLADRNQRCTYKSEHNDWPIRLIAKRQSQPIEIKERKAAASRLKKAQASPTQCTETVTQGRKGTKCSDAAVKDGLCTVHWRTAND